MASDNEISPPEHDAPNEVISQTFRRFIYMFQGKYDADARIGYDERDPLDAAHINPTVLEKKHGWAFPIKLWGYDGLEDAPPIDAEKTPDNAHSRERRVNTDDYAVSVMSREREEKKAFAVYAFKGYDGAGEVIKAPLIDVSGDEPKVSRDGVEVPEPIVNTTMFTEMLEAAFPALFAAALNTAIPRGTMWPIKATKAEILAINGGNATTGYFWAPCDGGTYKSARDGTNVSVPNATQAGLRNVDSQAVEVAQLAAAVAGADTINIQHNHSGPSHTHGIGSVGITISSLSASGSGSVTLPGHTHGIGTHVHDMAHGHNGATTATTDNTNRSQGSGSSWDSPNSGHTHPIPGHSGNTGQGSGSTGAIDSGGGSTTVTITSISGSGSGQIASGSLTQPDGTGVTGNALSTTQSIISRHIKVWYMYKL